MIANDAQRTLRASVEDGLARLEKLEAIGSLSAPVEEATKCVDILDEASRSVRVLFGRLTSVEELADADLECLFAPYYLGKALQRLRVSELRDRLALVRRSRAATSEFVDLVSRLALVDDERYDDQDMSAASQRASMIARHERRRETRRKLEEADDERDVALLRLIQAAENAWDDLRLQDCELEMLDVVVNGNADSDTPPPQRRGDSAWLTAPPDQDGIRVIRVLPGENDTLQVHRDRIRAAVFTPDPRRLPTVSLEEAADAELADALQRQANQGSEPASKPPDQETRRTKQLEEDGDEDDEARYDVATKRDEAWDVWKEEHPPGSGNKGDHIY